MTEIQSLFFYIISFLVSGGLAGIAQKIKKRNISTNKKRVNTFLVYLLFILSMSIPIAIFSIRYNVGIDYQNYVSLYYENLNVSLINSVGGLEIGYMLLIRLSSFFSLGPEGVFFFSSLITISFLYASLQDHLEEISFFLVLYLYYTTIYAFTLNVVRQGIAMSIVLYSFKFINEKNAKKYLFFIILAAFFHKTAIITIPVYFIEGRNNKVLKRLLFIFIIIIFVLNIDKLLSIPFFSKYYSFIKQNIEFNINLTKYLSDIAVIILSMIFRRRLFNKNRVSNLYIWLFIYGILLNVLGGTINYADRLGIYFTITLIFIIPYLVSAIENKLARNCLFILAVAYGTSVFIMANYITNSHNIIPYNFIIK